MVVACVGELAGWPAVPASLESFAARASLDNAAVADALQMLVSLLWG